MKAALFFLTLGTFGGAGVTFLTQVVLARSLSPIEFGSFSAALSLVTLVTPLAGFGIAMFWLKAFGEEGWQGLRWVRPSLKFTFLSTALVLIIVYTWAIFAPHDQLSRNLLFILAFIVIGQVTIELSGAIYQLEESYRRLALWQFFPHALRFSLILLIWVLFSDELDPIDVAIIYAITAFIMLAVRAKLLYRLYKGKLSLKGHENTSHKLEYESRPNGITVLNECWPFGLAGVFYLIYFQSSIVLVKYILGDESAAQYRIAIVIMTAVYLFPSVIYQKLLLPKIHRWANHDRRHLRAVYKKGNISMFLLGVVAAIVVYFMSPVLIPLVFGTKYEPVVPLLETLVLAIPFRFVATSIGSMLVTHSHMRNKVFYIGFSAFVSLLFGYVLIPYFGVIGAVYSAIITEVVQFIVYFVAVKFTVFRGEYD